MPGTVTAEFPASAADELIAARQANMAAQSSLIDDIMMAIGADADITQFKDAGDAMAALGEAIPDLFAAGTEIGHETRALPRVWSDRTGFEKYAADLVSAAQSMAKAAAADQRPAFVKAYRATFSACSGCHFTYRGDRVRTP